MTAIASKSCLALEGLLCQPRAMTVPWSLGDRRPEPTFPWLSASPRKYFHMSNTPFSSRFPGGGMTQAAGEFALHHPCFLFGTSWKEHTSSLSSMLSVIGTSPLGTANLPAPPPLSSASGCVRLSYSRLQWSKAHYFCTLEACLPKSSINK